MKKKVLFVIHQLNYGGVQKALLTALNAIDYSQNEVTLYIRKDRTELIQSVNKKVDNIIVNRDSTHYYRKPYMIYLMICEFCGKIFRKNEWLKKVQQKKIEYLNEKKMKYEKEHYFFENEEYDVAISYIQGYTADFVARYIPARKKVMFFHGSTDENHELHERIMSSYECIVGVNEKIREILQELYPRYSNKMTYIENYVDVEEVRKKSKEFVVARKKEEEILCSCGRFTHVKGFDIALEAAEILKDKGVTFTWYFVGDGPERIDLERKIKEKDLSNCIIITGMLENPYPYMAACDFYVQPSREEAHPLTIIEALILCRPVVTTATVGGLAIIKDGINGNVSLINEVSLAEAIEKMIKDAKKYDGINKIDYEEKCREYIEKWRCLIEG